MQSRLAWNSFSSPGWPQTPKSPAPAFWTLRLQMCSTIPGCKLLLACFGFHFVRTVFDSISSGSNMEASGQHAPEVQETVVRAKAGWTRCSPLTQVKAGASRKLLILDNTQSHLNQALEATVLARLISDSVTHASRDPESSIWVAFYPLRSLVQPPLLSLLQYMLDPVIKGLVRSGSA